MFKDYDSVEVLARDAIRVEHFATTDLLLAKPTDPVGEVLGWMTGKVSEMEAIQAVMKKEDLLANQKLDQLRAILSTEQRQHLRTCIRAEMMKELSGG